MVIDVSLCTLELCKGKIFPTAKTEPICALLFVRYKMVQDSRLSHSIASQLGLQRSAVQSCVKLLNDGCTGALQFLRSSTLACLLAFL
jgi:hypothetical protein